MPTLDRLAAGGLSDSRFHTSAMRRINGYSTAVFGKMHQTPVWETSVPRAPTDFDGGKPGAGGTGTLLVNGTLLTEERIDNTDISHLEDPEATYRRIMSRQ